MADEGAKRAFDFILRPSFGFTAFRERSEDLEHLDKGDYTPEEYEGCMVELRRVNRFLGDSLALTQSFLRLLERKQVKEFSLLDVGAGSGELLRVTARWAREKSRRVSLVGLELNIRAAEALLEESTEFSEISAIRGDALRLPFADDGFDYVMCSLLTHHFKDDQVVAVLSELGRVARRRIFVIDLHRHPLAYFLFTTIGPIVLRNRLIREDGALSILRSFRPAELEQLAARANLNDVRVERRFPFRLVLSGTKSGGEAIA